MIRKNAHKEIKRKTYFYDDIIFGGQDSLCKAFANEIKQEFEKSMFGEMIFFVGL